MAGNTAHRGEGRAGAKHAERRLATVVLLCAAGILLLMSGSVAAQSPADDPGRQEKGRALRAPATGEEIQALIRDLSAASFERRTEATRRLCAIGMPAHEALKAAAESDDAEAALRAARLLKVFERVLFQGVEVGLSLTSSSIAWHQAVDLKVHLENRSAWPARVPFELSATGTAGGDARQVADMLDVAEWLRVRRGDDEVISLRVDDIGADDEVMAAVQRRLDGEPVESLAPGARAVVTARAFNRGWARFPLLDVGAYTLTFEYMPAWEDEVLAAAEIGKVVSAPLTITVTEAAPDSVSRGQGTVRVEIESTDGVWVARLINRTDQPMVINTSFGDGPPYAQGRWMYEHGNVLRDVVICGSRGGSWKDFDLAGLVEIQPGASLEVHRVAEGELREGMQRVLGAELRAGGVIYFSYSNPLDRFWQQRQRESFDGLEAAPAVIQSPISRRMLSGRHHSRRLAAPEVP